MKLISLLILKELSLFDVKWNISLLVLLLRILYILSIFVVLIIISIIFGDTFENLKLSEKSSMKMSGFFYYELLSNALFQLPIIYNFITFCNFAIFKTFWINFIPMHNIFPLE